MVSLNKNTILCYNQNDTINAGSSFTSYLWQDGSKGQMIKVTKPGIYKVIVENDYKCFSSDSVKVAKIAQPPANFLIVTSTICLDDSIILIPKNSFKKYLWSTGSTDDNIVVRPPSIVWLSVTDNNNCKGVDTSKIFAKDCPVYFYIPNAFTPNNDGRNDIFKPILTGRVERYQFSIYNRYGQEIFNSTDPDIGWDGRLHGQLQDTNIFVWFCVYKFSNKATVSKKGTVFLIK